MATLGPQIGSNIGFEQPVQQPRGGMADLVGMFASAIPTPKEAKAPKEPSVSDILAADKAQFYNDLAIGRAQQEQGNAKAGQRIVTSAYRTFSRKYGREHEDVNTAFQDTTGISYDVEVTGSAFDYEQIASTESFNIRAGIFQMENPGASQDQVWEAAMGAELASLATDQKIKDHELKEKVDWLDVERDYVEKAMQTGDFITGLINSAQEDTILTPEETKEIRRVYNDQFGNIRKPVGVDQTRWDNYKKDYLDPLTLVVDTAIGIGKEDGFNSDMKRALNQVVSKAVNQDKLPGGVLLKMAGDEVGTFDSMIKLLDQYQKDPEFIDNYGNVMFGKFSDMVEWVTEFEYKDNADALRIDNKEFMDKSDGDKRKAIVSGSSHIALEGSPGQIAADLLSQNKRLESTNNKALQPDDYSRVFGPAYFNGIQKVYQANPTIGRQIAEDAIRVSEDQEIAISRAIASEAAQLGFKFENGELVPDINRLSADVRKVVEEEFGGDWGLVSQMDTSELASRYPALSNIVTRMKNHVIPKQESLTRALKMTGELKRGLYETGALRETTTGIAEEAMEILNDSAPRAMSPGGGELLKEFEGYSATAYWDVDAWRGGYGSDTTTLRDGTVKKITKDTIVTKEDSDRDLARRRGEFQDHASKQVGKENWNNLPGNIIDALTSVTYNYGSLPGSVVSAIKGGGDKFEIARAVEGLAGHNGGINRKRRLREAAIIRGEETPHEAMAYSAPPTMRPADLDTSYRQEVEGGNDNTFANSQGAFREGDRDRLLEQALQDKQASPEGGKEDSGTKPTEETKGVSKAEATQVWGMLASESKSFLMKLFGSEEEILQALEDGVFDPEDVPGYGS